MHIQEKAQHKFRTVLLEHFEKSKLRNPLFSLRAYATKLDIHPAALSMILNGKRKVSWNFAKKVLDNLAVDPALLKEIEFAFEGKAPARKQDHLDIDHYHIISDWNYYAILSLMEMDDFEDSIEWIASKLNISSAKTKICLQKLDNAGLIKKDDDGKYYNPGVALETPEDVANLSVRRRQQENLSDAIKALHTIDMELREFSSMTMAINIDRIEEAKKMIREFKNFFTYTMEEGEKNQVYELMLSFFPRSNVELLRHKQ